MVLLFLINIFIVLNIKHDLKDAEACEKAREKETMKGWISYLQDFPKGWCVIDAEEELYLLAKKLNTRASWEVYWYTFPEGEHAAEAESKKNKEKKVGDLEWSDNTLKKMTWKTAQKYCKNLEEGGHNDWRLPNIDELRTLVKDRETATGGECMVSEKDKCLSAECWNPEKCNEVCSRDIPLCNNKLCHDSKGKCENIADGRYSKLGDYTWLWSSSVPLSQKGKAWSVVFYRGSVDTPFHYFELYVRCVRNP